MVTERFLILALVIAPCMTAGGKYNVLFLVADDMRPEIGAYQGPNFPTPSHPKMHTPNLDKLAAKSLLLERSYVQMAVCSPSRTSLLTGRRPDTTRVHDLTHYWRQVAGNFTTIPQYFKQNGYRTIGMGKIFHSGAPSGYDDPISWTDPYFRPSPEYWKDKHQYSWYAADDSETEKHPLIDMQTTQKAIDTLKRIAPSWKSGKESFFFAVGFHKPHLPFLFPSRFLKYYPENSISLPTNPYAPVDMPEVAWSDYDELRDYVDISTHYGYGAINTTLPDKIVKDLRRAYYSAITYTDSLLGKVVQTLEEEGLANNTIISFWGDHGWQLGEHGEWCKHTNFELATHAPMMVHVPGLTETGQRATQLTEFVDLFPTLAEAAGLPKVPLCPEDSSHVATCTEGVSLVPLMSNPNRKWKAAVFSQHPRMRTDGDIIMGYSMRTDRWRFTEWLYYDDVKYEPMWSRGTYGRELYDHQNDPEENVNRINDSAVAHIVEELHKQLRAGWRGALPPLNGNEIEGD